MANGPCGCGDPGCGRCFAQRGKARPIECECADLGCPHHKGYECTARAGVGKGRRLRRVDMEDRTGTRFCLPCAEDAFASGLFR